VVDGSFYSCYKKIINYNFLIINNFKKNYIIIDYPNIFKNIINKTQQVGLVTSNIDTIVFLEGENRNLLGLNLISLIYNSLIEQVVL